MKWELKTIWKGNAISFYSIATKWLEFLSSKNGGVNYADSKKFVFIVLYDKIWSEIDIWTVYYCR